MRAVVSKSVSLILCIKHNLCYCVLFLYQYYIKSKLLCIVIFIYLQSILLNKHIFNGPTSKKYTVKNNELIMIIIMPCYIVSVIFYS